MLNYRWLSVVIAFLSAQVGLLLADDGPPRSYDDRVVITQFATAPQIVHPVGAVFDDQGRLLVIESHTHFRPQGYQGPERDRIRVVEDTDQDGQADRFTTYYEGTTATMDLARHPSGWIYVATRSEIFRLRDSTGDGRADQREEIVRLETAGNYPHNGLSGLAFDARGDLYFGFGENLGAAYKLIGSDGASIADEGEGGNVFWCTARGKQLRRVATGFWNPFGIAIGPLGRKFVADNDPDASPPCRLLHLVEQGNYGYQFRYGRSGRHPFQAWNGQLPGTLPMMAGTGEAPCEIISYQAEGLPAEYRGDLLVASWAEHRLERYVIEPHGASFTAVRKPFIEGGEDFRPVGIAVAPDGSLLVTDWVKRDYKLHGHGAIWHVRLRDAAQADNATEPNSPPDSAAKRAAELRAAAAQEATDTLQSAARNDPSADVRALAVELLGRQGEDLAEFLSADKPPRVRAAALRAGPASTDVDPQLLLALLNDEDPFLRHAALHRAARSEELLTKDHRTFTPRQRQGLLLAQRQSGAAQYRQGLPQWLDDDDTTVQVLAAHWIADEKLDALRSQLESRIASGQLSPQVYFAYAAALARLDGQNATQRGLVDRLAGTLGDSTAPVNLLTAVLRITPPDHKQATVARLTALTRHADATVRREATQTLAERPGRDKFARLLDLVRDVQLDSDLRARAIAGLATQPERHLDLLMELTASEDPVLRNAALRALPVGGHPAERQQQLRALAQRVPESAPLVHRVLRQPFHANRPPLNDLSAWQKHLAGTGDAAAGRRLFFHPRVASCARCHRHNGRGSDVGPDLSTIAKTSPETILESILQPSRRVAPQFQAWAIADSEGRVRSGLLVHTHLDEQTYVDQHGGRFKINTREIESRKALDKSIMPEGLVETLTDRELRDLWAFLQTNSDG